MKKKVLVPLLGTLAFLFGITAMNAGQECKALAAENTFEMTPGGSIRIAEPYGLRFQVKMSNDVKEKAEKVGMLIFPADYLVDSGADGDVYYESVEALAATTVTKHRMDLDLTSKIYEDDGYWYGNGAIVNIKGNNMSRKFVGIAYYEVEGEKVFADTSKVANTTRSAAQVAFLSSADKENTYSEETRTLLSNYIDYLKDTNVDEDATTRYQIRGFAADNGLRIKAVQYVDNVVKTGEAWTEQTHLEAQIWQHNIGYGVEYGLNVDTYCAFWLDGSSWFNNNRNIKNVTNTVTITDRGENYIQGYRYEICYNIFVEYENNLSNPQDGPYAFVQFKHHLPGETEEGFEKSYREYRDESRYLWQDDSSSYEFREEGLIAKNPKDCDNLENMLIDKDIVKHMAKLTSLSGGQPLPLESGQALFTNRTYVVGQDVAPSLYGKSYFYDSIDGSSCKVIEDGYVIIAFPNPYTAIREQAVSQGFEPLLVDKKPFGRRFIAGPLNENVDYYVKYCKTGEKINFGKWAIVIFETLKKEEYFVPEWIGTPANLISKSSELKPYDVSTRLWHGIPTIEKTADGRYFAGYGSGGNAEPHMDNYTVYAYSDDGKNWKDLMVVTHPSGKARCFDASVWIDPTGQLWMFWSQANGEVDGFIGVWAITIDPNGTEEEMREAIANATPRRIADGIKLNKPVVLQDGTWMFAALDERSGDYTSVYVSEDEGVTWIKRSTATVIGCLHADEPMILELAPNELALFVRATDGTGIRVAYSHDNGYSWEKSVDSGLGGPCSRFHIRRLPSGNLLLINHYENLGRSNLTALLSMDNGATWEHTVLIDQRAGCSYPDATVSDDGVITLTWDYERNTHGCVYMAEFTEDEIIKGGVLSRTKISTIAEITSTSYYVSNTLGNSDDFFATRGFVVNDGVAVQNIGGEHEIYFKDIEHQNFYASTEITAESIYNNDIYPKFGIWLRSGRQSLFFYIDGGNNLTNKGVGYVFRDNWIWDWDNQVTKSIDIAYTNGQYTKLAVLSKDNRLILYVNDEAVFTVPLSEEWAKQDISVGFKTFNTKACFRNNVFTTEQEALGIISGERAVQVEGTLTDVVGNVVANATISTGAQTVITDAKGKFVLPNVTCGNDSITVSACGFITEKYSLVLNDFLKNEQGVIRLSDIVLTRDYVNMGSLTNTKNYTWNFATTRSREGFLFRFVSSANASAVINEVNIWMSIGSTEPDAGSTSGRNRGFWQFQFVRNADKTLSLQYRNAPNGMLGSFRKITSGIEWTVDEQGVMTIECLLPYGMFSAYDSAIDVSSEDIVGIMYTICIDNAENAEYIYTFEDGTQHTCDKRNVKSLLRIDSNNYIFVSETNTIPDNFYNIGKLSSTNLPTWDLNIHRASSALHVKVSTTDEIDTTAKTGVKLFLHLGGPSTTRTKDTYVFDCMIQHGKVTCEVGHYPEENYVIANVNSIGKNYKSVNGVTTITLILPLASFDTTIGIENMGVAFETYCNEVSANWLYSDSYFTTDCLVDSFKPNTYLTITKDNQVYLLGEDAVQATMEEKGILQTDYEDVFANLAVISANAGEMATITNGGYMFKDRLTQNYLFQTDEAKFLEGKKYVYANISSSKFTVTQSGYVFLIVPDSGNFDTLNTNVKNGNWNLLFTEWNRMGKLGDRLNYYVKWCEKGENYNYGRWTLVAADSE